MPGYSDRNFLFTIDGAINIGGPATIGNFVDGAGSLFGATTAPAGSAYEYQTLLFPLACTVNRAFFNFGAHTPNPADAAGTVVRFVKIAYSSSGPTNGSIRKVGDVSIPSGLTQASQVDVGFNGGAGFEMASGETLWVYPIARAVSTFVHAVNLSVCFMTREIGPAPWASVLQPYSKGVEGSQGLIYPAMAVT